MNRSELDHARNEALKSAISTDHVQVEHLNDMNALYNITTGINYHRLQFEFGDLEFYAIIKHESQVANNIDEYFLFLENKLIDYKINSIPELSDEERTQLHEYLREFFIIYKAQMEKVAERYGVSLNTLFDKNCPYTL